MAWDETKGRWFVLGSVKFPQPATWKEISAVTGAIRTGAITKVDLALGTAFQASTTMSSVKKYLAAADLFLACKIMLQGIGAINLQAKKRRDDVTELMNRADRAGDYYNASARALNTIMETPQNILQMQSMHVGRAALIDALFKNFYKFAKQNWQYSAASNLSAEDLLTGRGTAVFCTTIAEAFRIVLDAVLKEGEAAEIAQIKGYFVTKPTYSCFDHNVLGNIRGSDGHIIQGPCLFNTHFFVKLSNEFYDPCMKSKYTALEEVVAEKLDFMPDINIAVLKKKNPTRNDFIYMEDGQTPVHGFRASYVRVKIGTVTNVNALRNALPLPLKTQINNTDSNAIATFCANVQ